MTGEQKDSTRKVRVNVHRITEFGNYAIEVNIKIYKFLKIEKYPKTQKTKKFLFKRNPKDL